MTRTANARLAGLALLLYIALGLAALALSGRAAVGPDILAKLAHLGQHAAEARAAAALNLLTGFAALVLGVTFYAITRDQDRDLALLGLACRVAEGVIGGLAIQRSLALVWLATASGANAPSAEGARALGASLYYGQTWSPTIGAAFFAVGSACFAWLLLRGRIVPAALAGLGVVASALLAVALPLQVAGVLSGRLVQWLWIPMAAFEIPLAAWFLVKGVAAPAAPPR